MYWKFTFFYWLKIRLAGKKWKNKDIATVEKKLNVLKWSVLQKTFPVIFLGTLRKKF